MLWRNKDHQNVEPNAKKEGEQESKKVQGKYQDAMIVQQAIGAFQLVGYPVWSGEAAGSSPVSYTWPVRLSVQDATLSKWEDGFDSHTGYKVCWCNGQHV